LKELKAEVKIFSSAESVWSIISDFNRYSDWNPVIKRIKGEPKLGAKLEIHLTTVGGKNRVYYPEVTKVEPLHEIRWYGKFFLSGIFSGERVLTIDKISENEVVFVNKEIFSGVGVKFTPKKMENDIIASFELMNNSLKKLIESKK
jgi:hypothetical protein